MAKSKTKIKKQTRRPVKLVKVVKKNKSKAKLKEKKDKKQLARTNKKKPVRIAKGPVKSVKKKTKAKAAKMIKKVTVLKRKPVIKKVLEKASAKRIDVLVTSQSLSQKIDVSFEPVLSVFIENLKNREEKMVIDSAILDQSVPVKVNIGSAYNFIETNNLPVLAKFQSAPASGYKVNKKIELNLLPQKESFWANFFGKKAEDNYQTEVAETETETIIEDIFALPDYVSFGNRFLPKFWPRKLAYFVVTLLILILPLQAFTYYQDIQDVKVKILALTNDAIADLKSGGEAASQLDLDKANVDFSKAKSNFILAQQEADRINDLAAEIIKLIPGQGKTFESGISLIEAGEIVSESARLMTTSGNNFTKNASVANYFQNLVKFQEDLNQVINNFKLAKQKITSVDISSLPGEHQATFKKVIESLPVIDSGLKDLHTLNESTLRALGKDQWQRYLVIFLNNNELRGGGGFMGSFAILDVDRGQIKKIEIPAGGTYDIQGQLRPKVIAPEPLHLINSRWEFQDANWFADYPSDAKKIEWFYLNSWNASVDGVITFTSSYMEKLLEVFGPIEMSEYGRFIDSNNFVTETQKIVQVEYDKAENRPKQFLADLAPKLLEKIFSANGEQMQQLMQMSVQALNERQILLYFNDEQTQQLISQLGWDGRVRTTGGDFLSVVHSNIAGGKTDRVIKETIHHQAQIQPDGSIIDTVRLVRQHTGVSGENIFTGVQNNSYVRFYVPLGSTLLKAEGFQRPPAELFEAPGPDLEKDLDLITMQGNHKKDEASQTDIYNESAKTVFGNWLMLKPGETKECVITYRLPFKLSHAENSGYYYSLLVQKQSGSVGSQLFSNLKVGNELKAISTFPSDIKLENNQINFNALLTTDTFYGAVLIEQ